MFVQPGTLLNILTKFDRERSWDLPSEMTAGRMKIGRGQSLTPWALLEEAIIRAALGVPLKVCGLSICVQRRDTNAFRSEVPAIFVRSMAFLRRMTIGLTPIQPVMVK